MKKAQKQSDDCTARTFLSFDFIILAIVHFPVFNDTYFLDFICKLYFMFFPSFYNFSAKFIFSGIIS